MAARALEPLLLARLAGGDAAALAAACRSPLRALAAAVAALAPAAAYIHTLTDVIARAAVSPLLDPRLPAAAAAAQVGFAAAPPLSLAPLPLSPLSLAPLPHPYRRWASPTPTAARPTPTSSPAACWSTSSPRTSNASQRRGQGQGQGQGPPKCCSPATRLWTLLLRSPRRVKAPRLCHKPYAKSFYLRCLE